MVFTQSSKGIPNTGFEVNPLALGLLFSAKTLTSLLFSSTFRNDGKLKNSRNGSPDLPAGASAWIRAPLGRYGTLCWQIGPDVTILSKQECKLHLEQVTKEPWGSRQHCIFICTVTDKPFCILGYNPVSLTTTMGKKTD